MGYEGNAWKFGDDVDTDLIIPARYLVTADVAKLAPHCMEDLDPDFPKRVRPGDVIVAGKNFGCGSSREHAPLVIKFLGVSVVVARSFARIFYRNAFNIGLALVECQEAWEKVHSGDKLSVDLGSGEVRNLSRDETYRFRPLPSFMMELLEAGGLIPLLRKGGWDHPS